LGVGAIDCTRTDHVEWPSFVIDPPEDNRHLHAKMFIALPKNGFAGGHFTGVIQVTDETPMPQYQYHPPNRRYRPYRLTVLPRGLLS
jgi:hypothetical protein